MNMSEYSQTYSELQSLPLDYTPELVSAMDSLTGLSSQSALSGYDYTDILESINDNLELLNDRFYMYFTTPDEFHDPIMWDLWFGNSSTMQYYSKYYPQVTNYGSYPKDVQVSVFSDFAFQDFIFIFLFSLICGFSLNCIFRLCGFAINSIKKILGFLHT